MGSAKGRGADGVNHGGRPRSLTEEHLLVLREIVAEHPGETLDAVTRLLHERCRVTVHSMTVRRARSEAGIQRIKPVRRAVGASRASHKRYGYTAAHRREHNGLATWG